MIILQFLVFIIIKVDLSIIKMGVDDKEEYFGKYSQEFSFVYVKFERFMKYFRGIFSKNKFM